MKDMIDLGISTKANIHYNLTPADLVEKARGRKEVVFSNTGVPIVYTDKYTGRSPQDRYIVDSPGVHDEIEWGNENRPIALSSFEGIHKKVIAYLEELPELFVFEGFVGADKTHKVRVRVIAENAYEALFANHLFRRFEKSEQRDESETNLITILVAPSVTANPTEDNTNSEAFVLLDLDRKLVLIGGTKYCGEIKKSAFSIMNYLLPKKKVFPMHCSANCDKNGTTALFFGLSGTGKTSLSTDPNRNLIGDDEHGWSKSGVFNFEGGCYAKCINLSPDKEPDIFQAIREAALVENVVLKKDGSFDFDDGSLTENTRVGYPLNYLSRIVESGVSGHPRHIIFLTADAFGVLPPIAKLDVYSAMYHFISGYTSKLAGTERGIKAPKAVFSRCFGAPFMPHKTHVYADLLHDYLDQYQPQVYLVNTGWHGGAYGVGKRFDIADTRQIVQAALSDELINVPLKTEPHFNLSVPTSVPGIDQKLLEPRSLWQDKKAYDSQASQLVQLFVDNMKRFNDIDQKIIQAGPQL